MFVEHKEVGEVTKAPAKIMKLSEAIRVGAKFRPQTVGIFSDYSNGTCAIGSAHEAVFGYLVQSTTDAWINLRDAGIWPAGLMTSEVFYKNDSGWTREQIADWLEARGL